MNNNDLFRERAEKHDKLENEVMDMIRPFTDRRHLPDRRISFADTPCSWDFKATIFVEDSSRDEYFRLWNDGEPVFIVYLNNDGKYYADWITNLSWLGPFPPSKKSTCNDPYYRIDGGRELMDFVNNAKYEVESWSSNA